MNSLYLLLSLDPASLALLFWFTLLFDLPRYVISLAVITIFEKKDLPPAEFATSAIVAGHNEADTIRACVESLDVDQVIVVDDGSTDRMWTVVEQLRCEGLVHHAIRLPIRSSKVTAINMALANCVGGTFILMGWPCSLARRGLGSKVSTWDGPPSMKRKMTCLALGA